MMLEQHSSSPVLTDSIPACWNAAPVLMSSSLLMMFIDPTARAPVHACHTSDEPAVASYPTASGARSRRTTRLE